MPVHTLNHAGQWVPAIPEPLHSLGARCPECGARRATRARYREHYALAHIIDPDPAEETS